ncbi:MAG: hemerythrin domain-containing protein [Chloroflexota bacterium]|jgi:hemerythrin-like domain-containing protein
MRIQKALRPDQENITRFLNVLGSAATMLSSNKYVRPAFFIQAHDFIQGYIVQGFYTKEEVLIRTLAEGGFPDDDGPILGIRGDQEKSRESARIMLSAARHWQEGDEEARVDVGWASSTFTSSVRQHQERLKNLIFPLLEQTITIDEEHKVSDDINNLDLGPDLQNGAEKYLRLIESLEETLSDWR